MHKYEVRVLVGSLAGEVRQAEPNPSDPSGVLVQDGCLNIWYDLDEVEIIEGGE